MTAEVAERIPERGAVVAFRNVLIHGYAAVIDELVWGTLQGDNPAVRARVAQLLEDLDHPLLT